VDEPFPSPPGARRLLIVDGHAYAYRAYYAIRELTSPAGAPTHAIYGFIRMIEKMVSTLQPSHWSVIWDGGLCAERLAALPEYKGNRPPSPPGLHEQIGQIERYLGAAGVPSWMREGVEADDWIATLARQAEREGFEIVIASSDKDFLQLVGSRTGLLNPNDKSEKLWGAEDVRGKTGVNPEQVVDWLSLIGDSVDNIAGVPGIGPGRAAELVQQFGSIDALYERLDEVKSDRMRVRLAECEPVVRRNQQLIRLKDVGPAVASWETLRVRPPDAGQLRTLYAEWGFKSLLAQLSGDRMLQTDLL
jgi:DNA polymerase-1